MPQQWKCAERQTESARKVRLTKLLSGKFSSLGLVSVVGFLSLHESKF